MRRYHTKVFDNRVEGPSAVYSDSAFDEALASTDRVMIACMVTNVSGADVTLTVAFEHSPDGMYWTQSGEILIDGEIAVGEMSIGGGIAHPMSGFARLKITLGGTSPGADLQVYAAGRDPLVSVQG